MRIKKELVAQSIQNYRDVWGKFYVFLEGRIQKILIKRERLMKDANSRVLFDYKDHTYELRYDLDRHLVCQAHYFFTRAEAPEQSLIFKNYWYAHAFMLRMQKRKGKK